MMLSMSDNSRMSGGESATMSPVTRIRRPFSKQTIRLSAKRTSLNIISTVTNQGTVRFMVYRATMSAKVLIEFLKRLLFIHCEQKSVSHSR